MSLISTIVSVITFRLCHIRIKEHFNLNKSFIYKLNLQYPKIKHASGQHLVLSIGWRRIIKLRQTARALITPGGL